jgi:hypothetical protein
MRKGFLIYEEMRKYIFIYEEAVSRITLQLLHSEFPYTVYEEHLIFFLNSAECLSTGLRDRPAPLSTIRGVVSVIHVSLGKG